MMFEQDRQRLKIRERILLEENSRLRKEEEKREVARIQALERDPLRVHDLVEESQHIVSDYDARSKAEEEEQLRTQAEQEVYGLYAEEEERLRVNAEEKSEQGAARLDSRLECLRIEAEKIFARFDAEEVEREQAAHPEPEEEEQLHIQAEQGAARLETEDEEEHIRVNAEEKHLRPKAGYEEHL